ncbi:MAG TPA: hypothetical protein VKF60_11070 [Myxococcota bacterium]|nr:hypothetical protein [Myxococcota bacterium]
MIPVAVPSVVALLAFALGFGAAALWRRGARRAAAEPVASEVPPEVKPLTPVRDTSPEDTAERGAAPHLITLIGDAMREPLRLLRRASDTPSEAIARLERIAWQTRMLVSRPRPMRAAPTSPVALLQEAAEQIPLLRDGSVGASWSLLNRQPVYVDSDRIRGAFRGLLESGAELAGPGGRVGIKILHGKAPGFPVQIEIEIGRRGTELDPLVLLVTRHLIESQGGRLELDGNVTRILLRNAAADPVIGSEASVA